MKVARYLLIGLLAIGLVITSIGWYRSERSEGTDDGRFGSCRFEGSTLVLTYTYGANQLISPSVDTRGSDIVIKLNTRTGEGITPAIGLSGEARFGFFGEPKTVRYEDGKELTCPRRAPGD